MKKYIVSIAIACIGISNTASAQIYSEGQSIEQQGLDINDCIVQAKDESGFDPFTAVASSQDENVLKGFSGQMPFEGIINSNAGIEDGTQFSNGVAELARQKQRPRPRQSEETARQLNAKGDSVKYKNLYRACLKSRGYRVVG